MKLRTFATKNVNRFILALAFTLPLAFSSCSQGGSEDVVANKNTLNTETAETQNTSYKKGTLSVVTENVPFSPNSRTILPKNVNFETDGNFKFILSGKWKSEKGEDAYSVTIATWETDTGWTADSTGKKSAYQKMISDDTISVQTGLWDFYLDAKNTGFVSTTAFTKTLTDVMISSGTNTLSFGEMEEADKNGFITLRLEFPPEAEGEVSYIDVEFRDLDGHFVDSQTIQESSFNTYNSNSSEVINGEKTEGTRYLSLTRNSIAIGSYRVFFYLYNSKNLLVKTARDIIRVSSGRGTNGTVIVKNLNTVYKINYMGLNDIYNCVSGYQLESDFIDCFNESETITLPSSEMKKDAYFVGGWYLKEDYSGDAITGWLPGESPRADGETEATDVTLYPKWYTTGSDAATAIYALKTAGVYTIRVKGEVTADDFKAMNTKIQSLSNNVFVTLDFSESTFTTLPERAFWLCTQLKGITLPSTVTTIGLSAFSGCSSLEAIAIPAAITTIGNYAFNGCSKLKSIRLEDATANLSVGFNANQKSLFFDCPLENIYIGRNLAYSNNKNNTLDTSANGYSAFARYYSPNSTPCSVEIGKTVTKIPAYCFYGRQGISSVEISPSAEITSIGASAFYACLGLKNITIPSTVTFIGESAFYGCSSLESISIPAATTKLYNFAFNECSKLATIRLEDGSETLSMGYNGNQRGLFYSCPLSSIYIGRNLIYYNNSDKTVDTSDNGYSAFARYYTPNSTPCSVEIGKTVTKITSYYFYGRQGISSVEISPSAEITSIGASAFYACLGLKNITIPSTVTVIGETAFSGCSSLESISIPAATTKISNYAFNGCTKLASVRLEDGSETLSMGFNANQKGLFYDCPLSNIYIGRNLIYYNNSDKTVDTSANGYSAFARYYTPNSTPCSVEIGKTVTKITSYYFYGRQGISSVEISPSAEITSIGASAFYACLGLKNITIPSTVTFIGESAFSRCSSLESISIPAATTKISNYAFYGCTKLASVRLEDGSETLSMGFNANQKGLFYDCPLSNIYIGRNLTYYNNSNNKSDSSSNGYSAFASYYSPNSTPCSVEIGGNVNTIQSYCFYGRSGITSVSISPSASITSIGSLAFYNCSVLKTFTIPSDVKTIGQNAFNGCSSLESISIPETTTTIATGAFNGCNHIKSVRLEDGTSNLSVGYNNSDKGLFYDCPLESIYIGRNLKYGSNSNSYDSSANGYSAFANNVSIQEVTVSPSVTELGNYIFYGCSGIKKLILAESSSEEPATNLTLGNNGSTNAGLFSAFNLDEFYLGRTVSFSTKPFKKAESSYAYIPKKITIGSTVSGIPLGFLHCQLYTNWSTLSETYPLIVSESDWYYTSDSQKYSNREGGTAVPANLTDADKKEYFIIQNANNYYLYRTLVTN